MKNLIVYMILSAVVLNLSPGKNYRRYIALFSGLVLIIMLARPVSELLNIDSSSFLMSIENYVYYGNDVTNDVSLEELFDTKYQAEEFLADKPNYITYSEMELKRRELEEQRYGEIQGFIEEE